jgi:SAM-dependent methyltransferase
MESQRDASGACLRVPSNTGSVTPWTTPTVTVMARHQSHRHHHGHVHLDDADWDALAADTELEGELLLAFVTDSAHWIAELRGPDAPPVRRVLDIGSGPGVGTCELARLFPDAHVVAVDGSTAMLDRTTQRAAAHGLDRRITTHLAELPDGVDGLDSADVIWASMSLHHIGDETNALRVLGDLLERSGLLAVAEVAEPMRVLPDDLDVGQPGLADRLDRAESNWFAAMRAGLSGSVPSTDLASMLSAAGFDVIGSRLTRERFDPPLSDAARQVVLGRIRRARQQLDELLDDDDLRTLDVLSDANDPRGVMHRADVFVASSRQIVVARPLQDP